MLVAPAFLITMTMATYEGIVAYTYYETRGCDPIKNKEITNSNQVSESKVYVTCFTHSAGSIQDEE